VIYCFDTIYSSRVGTFAQICYSFLHFIGERPGSSRLQYNGYVYDRKYIYEHVLDRHDPHNNDQKGHHAYCIRSPECKSDYPHVLLVIDKCFPLGRIYIISKYYDAMASFLTL